MVLEFNSFYIEFLKHLVLIGFDTKMVETNIEFKSYHNQTRSEKIPLRVVIDPLTGKEVLASVLFEKYIESVVKQIFINPNRIEISKILNNEIKEHQAI